MKNLWNQHESGTFVVIFACLCLIFGTFPDAQVARRVQARIDSAVRSASSRGSKGGAPTPTEPTFIMMALRVAVVLCSLSWATAQLSESVDCDQSFALQRCLFVVGWCHWRCTLGVHTYGHTLILSHTIKTIIAMFKAFAPVVCTNVHITTNV